MQVPKLDKIVINIGVGDGSQDSKFIEASKRDLEAITGQKAVITKAKNQKQDLSLEKVKQLVLK